VTPGAFDELTSLESLNLISNPFNCNCHMTWFADWLRQKGKPNNGQILFGLAPIFVCNEAIPGSILASFKVS
jgi:hypothetical protein